MWPYEFFNEYSALLNEFNYSEEARKVNIRKVFLAKWFGNKTDKRSEELKERAIKKIINNIDEKKIIYTSNNNYRISDYLRYKFEVFVLNAEQRGDLNYALLGKILEASLFVAYIGPVPDAQYGEPPRPVFNENVIAELGLALAWKMPEQVIILCDSECKLPFDLQGYFANKIEWNNNKLKNEKGLRAFIKKRIDQLEFKKSVLVNNVKGKLDSDSLSLLVNQRGLLFVEGTHRDSFYHHLEVATNRHLLNLGILRIEKFPPSKKWFHTFGYTLTDFGRIILQEMGVKLYPRNFCELLRVAYWQGHPGGYPEQKKAYRKEFKLPWGSGDKFLRSILSNLGEKSEKNVITMFNNYCAKNRNNFEVVLKTVIRPWEQKTQDTRDTRRIV